ncbi:MAG: NAD-dependent deacylase, partial [Bacteroidales bacterium]|nr:NAD-dependent deacylase [Bacteroidales bacterium]
MKKKIAVLTGAGVSAESGISTFRDNGGLWDRYDPQVVASIDGWRADRGLLLDFYNMERRHLKDVQP